ncbi:hypothetical protein EQV77_07490 [Halobacillus fulvus]|nr:hypothetical protein EQV77_07490 [Halobacillus fulvus]
MRFPAYIQQSKPVTILFLLMAVSAIVLINWFSTWQVENIMRSVILFLFAPIWIMLANDRHLWFRRKYRWIVTTSLSPLRSLFIFFTGCLVSYEVSLMLPFGFWIHLFILSFASIVYWAPLLIECPFSKQTTFMSRFAYFAATAVLFFLYHQISFLYYEATPTLGFMVTGLITMSFTLLTIIQQWSDSEKQVDRLTAKGHVHSMRKKEL